MGSGFRLRGESWSTTVECMYERGAVVLGAGAEAAPGPTSTSPSPVPEAGAGLVQGWRQALTRAAQGAAGWERCSDAQRMDLVAALEQLKCAAEGAQAVLTAAFAASQRAAQAAAGYPADRRGRGVAAQVALARRESPYRGAQHTGLATILTRELPHTLAALTAGRITQWRASVIARETGYLSVQHRALIDAELAGTAEGLHDLEHCGDRRLIARILRRAQELDVEAVLKRRRRAETERRVSARPAPDTMMYLTALVTARDGVGVIAALRRDADSAVAAGDPRTRDQIMADLLVARVTGREPVTGATPVTIDLIITDAALFDGADLVDDPDPADDNDLADDPDLVDDPVADDAVAVDDAVADADGDVGGPVGEPEPAGLLGRESAYLVGYGLVPAELARQIAAQALAEAAAPVWLRRLYVHPGTGALVAMESRARLFPAGLARFIRLRDGTCRTPWCEAPIRHIDHVVPHADAGPTSAANGQGLCAACNIAKQAPGWHTRASTGPPGRHTVKITTPTGHTYTSTAPRLAG